MPITKSAKKALRQSKKRRAENLVYRKGVKNLVKKIEAFVLDGKLEEAKSVLPKLYKYLDKAAKKNVIKKNTASRKKSRITKFVLRQKNLTK
ncbi:MAG TPA: 30S ribosomal protein S20 [Candidatus Parcubacteria bacterium]|nr:30S ribosomal protein S20 [Candidatus Parcubacteria bacterium]